MKTDDLLDMLSAGDVRVQRKPPYRAIVAALAIGGAAAVIVSFAILGFRTDLAEVGAAGFVVMKLSFTVGVIALAFLFLTRLTRPGGEHRTRPALLVLPFVAIAALGLINLSFAPPAHWEAMVLGDQWLECLLSIPIIGIVPFVVAIWAVRKGAPTDLRLAGAAAGLFAGGVSATAYAFHCIDDSLPFVTLWYGRTILLCTLAGAALGPRLLRW